MAKGLKKYVVVGFFSEQEARQAFSAALAQFRKSGCIFGDLSRIESNIIYFYATTDREAKLIQSFLLSQEGAQPEGCHCPVNIS